jgi:hypothetical protein
MVKYIKSLVAGCLLLLYSGAAATAATTTFNFAGNWPGGSLSGSFSGSFSFDPSTIASISSDPTLYTPVSFTLDVFDDASIVINLTGAIQIDENSTTAPFVGYDIFQVGKYNGSGLSEGDPLDSYVSGDVIGISIDLLDSSGTALTDESLPTALSLTDWDSPSGTNLVVRYIPTGSSIQEVLFGQLSSLELASEVAAVPLPATLPLFGAGLGALGLLGWRRQRRATA